MPSCPPQAVRTNAVAKHHHWWPSWACKPLPQQRLQAGGRAGGRAGVAQVSRMPSA